MNEFGNRLRKLRKQKKMTLRYLAERANLSYSFIASLEKGRYNPSRESIFALASPLEVDVNELLILAGYLPDQTEAIPFFIDKLPHKEIALEKVMEGMVTYNGMELSEQEKNSLLAFLQTLIRMKD